MRRFFHSLKTAQEKLFAPIKLFLPLSRYYIHRLAQWSQLGITLLRVLAMGVFRRACFCGLRFPSLALPLMCARRRNSSSD